MPRTITFVVPGKPGAKQRHRNTKKGHVYTPIQTIDYENLIRFVYLQQKNRLWFTGYVHIAFTAYFKIPKSTSKKKTQEMLDNVIEHDKKPDVDNILKIIMDGLTGAAYPDDKQVTKVHVCEKLYTLEEEKIVVTLSAKNADVKEV